jgi:site-specific DNA-methyltransferase (adenine-specific)
VAKIILRFGECLERMKDIPDQSVDLVLTDPPYNISRTNNFATMGRAGIDFGEWGKNADLLTYISDVYRVLISGGAFIVFNGWRNLGIIDRHAATIGFESKDMIRLEKRNPMPRNRDRRYITDYECGIWFVKPGAKWVFNRLDPKYQRPKFEVSVRKGVHPTQKDLSAMEDLIKIHSNAGGVVLDPYMGSGTTGVAALNLGRRFIGIEKDPKYYKIAKGRILGS